MSVSNISFMSAKPSSAMVKKAAEKAEALKEQAVYYGKEPMGTIKEEVGHRAADLKSYVDSRQQVVKDADKVSADKLAEAYKAAHGIQ